MRFFRKNYVPILIAIIIFVIIISYKYTVSELFTNNSYGASRFPNAPNVGTKCYTSIYINRPRNNRGLLSCPGGYDIDITNQALCVKTSTWICPPMTIRFSNKCYNICPRDYNMTSSGICKHKTRSPIISDIYVDQQLPICPNR
jgi:hypothetical protein